MKTRRLILGACWLNFLVAGVTAETEVVRPGPCAAHGAFLLAANSGALISAEQDESAFAGDYVIMFRRKLTTGWASQRLLRRFDLELEEGGPRIFNSGTFCTGVN